MRISIVIQLTANLSQDCWNARKARQMLVWLCWRIMMMLQLGLNLKRQTNMFASGGGNDLRAKILRRENVLQNAKKTRDELLRKRSAQNVAYIDSARQSKAPMRTCERSKTVWMCSMPTRF